MSRKSAKIASLILSLQGRKWDAHYLGYFVCFNQQLFFEAHEVLEVLWLPQRGLPRGLFYKGLIQLAGAFVHIQKKRRQPALALLKLARDNLSRYPSLYEALDIDKIQKLIAVWMGGLATEARFLTMLETNPWPQLSLDQPK